MDELLFLNKLCAGAAEDMRQARIKVSQARNDNEFDELWAQYTRAKELYLNIFDRRAKYWKKYNIGGEPPDPHQPGAQETP